MNEGRTDVNVKIVILMIKIRKLYNHTATNKVTRPALDSVYEKKLLPRRGPLKLRKNDFWHRKVKPTIFSEK